MHTYTELKDMLCEELEKITKKGELSAGSLDVIDKLTHSIKSIDTIVAMEDAGYSNDYWIDGRTNRGSSYARERYAKRDSMGRYSRERGYSRDDARDEMVEDLKELMHSAPDEQTKKEFQKFINRMENM